MIGKFKRRRKHLNTISKANRKAIIFVASTSIFIITIIVLIFYYFFQSKLESALKNDKELYFSLLFINEKNEPYAAYIGVVSSLHDRIGLIGLPSTVGLWFNKNENNIPIYELYKNGGRKNVFKAIEKTIGKDISYNITINNEQLADIIDLVGGVKMYVEEPIKFIDEAREYNLSFDIGEWIFQGNKVIAYINYLNMRGYEDREILYRLDDVLINAMIGLVQNPELRTIMRSKDIQRAIYGKIKSNLRYPDIKSFFKILANSSERTLTIESIDARVDDRGVLTPILDGNALIKQVNDLTLYVGLKTQKSEIFNEDISVIVLNATDVVGLADRINIRMRYRGFLAGEYGNFSIHNLENSVVLIRDGQIEKAFKVANECKVSRVYAKTDRRLLNNSVLILGNDYYEITK